MNKTNSAVKKQHQHTGKKELPTGSSQPAGVIPDSSNTTTVHSIQALYPGRFVTALIPIASGTVKAPGKTIFPPDNERISERVTRNEKQRDTITGGNANLFFN